MDFAFVPVNHRNKNKRRRDGASQTEKPECGTPDILPAIFQQIPYFPPKVSIRGVISDLNQTDIIFCHIIFDEISSEIFKFFFRKNAVHEIYPTLDRRLIIDRGNAPALA